MKEEVLIVDGYNMIGSWPELTRLAKADQMGNARDRLLFELSQYAKYTNTLVKVVFDAQFVPGIKQQYKQYSLEVIFTEEAETADAYIERMVHEEISPIRHVTVATSDYAIQKMVMLKGVSRKSANELYKNVQKVKEDVRAEVKDYRLSQNRRMTNWREEDLEYLEEYYRNIIDNQE